MYLLTFFEPFILSLSSSGPSISREDVPSDNVTFGTPKQKIKIAESIPKDALSIFRIKTYLRATKKI
ncbi:MAG: hypothetical protein JXK07_10185 [Spirochaetes bacterium]|nr:hypothetical protein [Spirochaetota bacterium]